MDNIKILDGISKDKKVFYDELGKVIIGQTEIIEHIFIAILCKGHILLEGVPGLAKTLLVNTISKILGLTKKYLQSVLLHSILSISFSFFKFKKIIVFNELSKIN